MIELQDWLLILTFNVVAIVLVSVIVAMLLRWFMDWRMTKRLESCENTVKSGRNQAVQSDKRARLNEVAIRAAEKFHEAKATGQKVDHMGIFKDLALEYPDVALEIPGHLTKLAKKLDIGL